MNLEGSSHNSRCSELSTPPGFSTQIIKEGEEALNHPGLEDISTAEESPVRKGKALKNQIDLSEKRVTRSQSKLNKVSATNSECILNKNVSGVGVRVGSPFGSKSARTTDSIAKLAEEALEVGELLGIKVIANKENALRGSPKALRANDQHALPTKETEQVWHLREFLGDRQA